MNRVKFRLLLILFLVFSLAKSFAADGKYKKIKVVKQSFDVSMQSSVHIENSYGNVNVSTWQQNNVEVEVKIEVTGDHKEDLDERLNEIQIKLFQENGDVFGKTDLENVSSYSTWSWITLFGRKKTKGVSFKINYFVKMPVDNQLFIDNEYGNIYIDVLNGSLDLKADYGKFDIGELNAGQNRIQVDYFSSSNLDFIKNGTIEADYSKIDINNAYFLDIKADYTKINIGKVRKLYFSNDYGSIRVDDAMWVEGEGDYQTRYFANINYLDFKGDYGSIKIETLRPDFEKIRLVCDYTNVKIINTQQAAYHFYMDQDYGCFKYDNLKVYKQIEESGNKHIVAVYGNENTNSSIKINSDYGCVKIYNN